MTYFINYSANYSEEYVTLLRFEHNSTTVQTICFYGKEGNSWKLDFLNTNPWGTKGKDALAYYKSSKKHLDKGYLLNAFLEAKIANQYSRNAGGVFQYRQEEEIATYLNNLAKKMNETFDLPIKLDSLPGKPEIMHVIPQTTTEGFFPLIIYQTN